MLVTGATGFLGTALVERLVGRRTGDVRCLVRAGSDTSRLEALAAVRSTGGLEIFRGSLRTREEAARALDGVSVVYHLAASLRGAPADVFMSTVVATSKLAAAVEAAAAQGRRVKVVLVSSFAVYGAAMLPRGARIDEAAPLEQEPERRDVYAMAKLRQEAVLREAAARAGFPLVVVRPGVIYGPRGGALSARVGLALPGVFLHLGGENPLPLTYVENCAEAVAVAAESPEATAQPVNVVDDDLPTCAAYLARYRREVARLRVVRLPWAGLLGLAALVERYHAASKGQLPAVLTPYKARALWGGNRFGNERLKALGWRQPVPTEEGLARTFAWLRARGQG